MKFETFALAKAFALSSSGAFDTEAFHARIPLEHATARELAASCNVRCRGKLGRTVFGLSISQFYP
jgi:hypothetical protein